ncbi:hypothetical protein CXF68_12890 [Tenacibaculum sp. Bg11-29]|nr:hypothetical protein CXF68_12890 [Tenacibaculum sp. Bg11-29]
MRLKFLKRLRLSVFIIHINAIKDIVSYTNSCLQLKLYSYYTDEIIVSRERVKEFKNWID